GLAGSGALTALVLATLPTATARLIYMAVFGLGSTLGMGALSGLLGWPLARMGLHHVVARAMLLLVGCVWGYPICARLFCAWAGVGVGIGEWGLGIRALGIRGLTTCVLPSCSH